MKTIIVTRHPGALAWLQKRHPELTSEMCSGCQGLGGNCMTCDGSGYLPSSTRVIAQATPKDLTGNRIIGILPVDLAALCGEYWALNMRIPAEMRGKELTCEDMERFGCSIKRFLVFPEERIPEVEHALAAELSRRVSEMLDGDD